MQGYLVAELTRAVRVLGLSMEAEIDFGKVKRSFRNRLKRVHPDKNGGDDCGLSSVLESYKLLDHFFNVALTGKNCHNCSQSRTRGPPTDYLIHTVNTHRTCGQIDSDLVRGSSFRDYDCKLENKEYKYPRLKEDRKCILGGNEDHECNIDCLEPCKPADFRTELSRGDMELLEGTSCFECRCGQIILVTAEAIALGIRTFDCDVCSCSYYIADV